jgi:hypothetical protein
MLNTVEPAFDENELLLPSEAVEFLETHRNVKITVDILRQMRRKGRVKATVLGKNSRTTVYRAGDLMKADITQHKAGRPRTAKQKES